MHKKKSSKITDYYEDLDDIVTLIQEGDTESIKSLPQSIVRDYIGLK